jgi:hypothetical protein
MLTHPFVVSFIGTQISISFASGKAPLTKYNVEEADDEKQNLHSYVRAE